MANGAAADEESEMPGHPIPAGIREIFQNDQTVRDAFTANLRPLSTASQALADRAAAAFAGFSASRYSAAARSGPTYLPPGGDLPTALESVITRGADARRAALTTSSLRLALSDDLQALINRIGKGGKAGPANVDLGALVAYVTGKSVAGRASAPAAVVTPCQAEREAEQRLAAIEAAGPGEGGPAGPEERAAAAPAAGDDPALTAQKLVRREVGVQMKTATSPESQLSYSVPERASQQTQQQEVQTFELRDGPSDVTSYHDFSSLQIAFEDVWTEVFDGQIRGLGEELYREYVKLKVFSGTDDGADRQITTMDDLTQLLADIRDLSMTVQTDMPSDLLPAAGGSGASSPAGSADLFGYAKAAIDPASVITGSIQNQIVRAVVDPLGAAVDLIGSLLAGKQQLTWSSFPGPLPGGNDVITCSFEENAAPPGTVAIVLASSPQAASWKGIEFWEFDADAKPISHFKISNDPRDDGVWQKSSYNTLPLYTSQVQNCMIEFQKEALFGVHTGYYQLSQLGQKLTDRTRVTFTWIKDS